MDRAWMYDLARIDPMYLENVRQLVEGAKRGMQTFKTKMIYFILVLTVKTKLRGRILK
jgi:hypothetical protein